MNEIYNDPELEPLLLAIKKLVRGTINSEHKKDVDYAVSVLFERVVFWELWEPAGEGLPLSNNPLFKEILGVVGSEEVARSLYGHIISWDSWLWEQKIQEDLEEAVFDSEVNDGIYGTVGLNNPSEYGDMVGPFDGVFELS